MKDIEVTFNPLFCWMLIGFGCVFFLIGLVIATPFIPRQNIAVGVLICIAAICAIVGGSYWLKHLPVMLRLTKDDLQLPEGQTVLWSDVERVDVKTLRVKRNNVGFVCIKLRPGRGQPTDNLSESVRKAFYSLIGDYDIILNEQSYSRPADWLAAEFNRRLTGGG